MIIPWNTDAPIYHPPVATVGLIAVNVLVFVGLVAVGPDAAEHLVLDWGQGLRPWQWVTSNFVHGDLLHLAGNMMFLWGFGLVIEGKLGWWRFLAVYLGLGIAECALEQAIMWNATEGGSYGASAALFGLLAMAMIWAPRNELSCLALLTFRPWTFDISILGFAFLYLVLQVVLAVFPEPEIGSAALHLLGAVLGLFAGVAMLKLDLVDCEGWDLFSVIAGREGERAEISAEAPDDEPEKPPIDAAAEQAARRRAALAQIRGLLKDGSVAGAFKLHQRLSETIRGWQLPADDLLDLVKALHREEAWADSVPLLVEYLRRFPEKSVRVRLRLAQVLERNLDRPAQALQVLSRLPKEPLEGPLEKARQDILRDATQRRDASASYEVGLEEW